MKKILTLFLALVASAGTILASETQVDGIWYNFNSGNSTASVTYRGSSPSSYSDTYTGVVVIPSIVEYNAKTYTVTSIGDNAFRDCSGLTSVTIPSSVSSIGERAFSVCKQLQSITIPNSVTSIGYKAFTDCKELRSITIPNSVTSIGSYVFWGCKNLCSIDVAVDNLYYRSVSGVLFSKDLTKLIQYPGGKQGAYVIPEGVTQIENMAFCECYGLTSVEIPNGVTSIGESTFRSCSALRNVSIGSSVLVLEEWAFNECTAIEIITCYSQRPPTVKNEALNGVAYTTIVYVPAAYLNTYKMHDTWGLYDVRPISNPTDPDVETGEYSIRYKDKNNEEIYQENVILHIPVAPKVEGFTFLYWQPVETNIANGFIIQAVYEAEDPSATPDVVSNPSNKAQKLIRQGNVYILTDDHTYTITGQKVK